ncbi:hypothetical protein HNV11_23255 [Spirosoma taeanense]|uniref:Uncharacterized protein n=1 Tax=Spirosoma taeanense TaxID=2735870 RepID=A0A6M5YFS6_9BACT|nr:hypothetical protein [Spirosoma taeanense]QJW92083.1 hypothetical protein HNV11_23255 [Spirosoma taeanense]
MRKVVMLVIGVTLFITGYHQTRRQTEYVTAKSAITTPTYTTPTTVSAEMKKSPAFRFVVKPS